MDNFRNTEPGIKDTAAQDSRLKETKPSFQKRAQIILDFLRDCTPYEADSIRVMVQLAETKDSNTKTIDETDMMAVNRYLNYSLYKEDGTTTSIVIMHRQNRAEELMRTVSEFVTKEQMASIAIALMKISSDYKTAEEVRQKLPPHPVPVTVDTQSGTSKQG